jgi:hypothetical protein
VKGEGVGCCLGNNHAPVIANQVTLSSHPPPQFHNSVTSCPSDEYICLDHEVWQATSVYCESPAQIGSCYSVLILLYLRGCIKKFPDWPLAARTANGTVLCHQV